MPKANVYEGKDVLLEMVREKVTMDLAALDKEAADDWKDDWKIVTETWNRNCELLSDELYQEGLITSSKEVLKKRILS